MESSYIEIHQKKVVNSANQLRIFLKLILRNFTYLFILLFIFHGPYLRFFFIFCPLGLLFQRCFSFKEKKAEFEFSIWLFLQVIQR